MSTLPILKHFQHEINRLFENPFFRNGHSATSHETSMWTPQVDIEENEKHYFIKANLPGVEAKNIEIFFQKGTLNIKGKLDLSHEEKEKNYIRCERAYGEFFRNFYLPDVSDDAKIEAKFENGVLAITLPKTKSGEVRRIEVKS